MLYDAWQTERNARIKLKQIIYKLQQQITNLENNYLQTQVKRTDSITEPMRVQETEYFTDK